MALGSGELYRQEIQDKLKLKDRRLFMSNYINIALEDKYIEMTIPDKPNSHLFYPNKSNNIFKYLVLI